jgi:hypothetical protein
MAVALREPPSDAALLSFQELLDRELGRASGDYARARATGALGAARVLPVDASVFTEHWHRRIAAGMRPPEIKDQVFQPDPAAWSRMTAPPR